MRFLLYTFACSYVLVGYSQSSKLTLLDALYKYEQEFSVNFAYDTEVLGLISEDRMFTANDLDTFISEVESSLPFVIEAVDETYYTISLTESNYFIEVVDAADNLPLPVEMRIIVLVNEVPIKSNVTNGGIIFNYKPSKTDRVQLFSAGFDPQLILFEELLNAKSLSKSLSISVIHLTGLTVKDYLTKGINLSPSNQSIKIQVRDLPLLPGETDGDIFASIAALPGITNPDGRAGNLYIRGSETDQTLILFDNIPVYHRGHYFGTISPYNPKIVDQVEVYRSGFHPRLGDRVGGAIMINTRPEPAAQPVVGVGANSLFGMGYCKVPLLNDRLGFSFGARHSYSRNFNSPKLKSISKSVFSGTSLVDEDGNMNQEVDVLFEDYHGKITYRMNDKNLLSFTTIYSQSTVDYLSPARPNFQQNPIAHQFKNIGFNLDWKSEFGDNWQSNFATTLSKYDYAYINTPVNPGDDALFSTNDLKDANIRQEFSKNFESSSFQIGVDYKFQQADYAYQDRPRADNNLFATDNSTSAHSVSPYANIDVFGWKKWFLKFGIRSTYYSELKDFRIAPRLLLNYEASPSITLKGSAGRYFQYLSQVKNLEFGGGGFDNELWTLADGDRGNIIDGTQTMVGAIMSRNEWIVDLEAFDKRANNITVYEHRRLEPTAIFFTMDQHTFGLDLLIKRQLGDDASIWLGYSYHDSEIRLDTTDQKTYASKYVQPDVWYIGGAFKRNRWKASAAWKYSSGLNAQSLDIVYAELLYRRGAGNGPPGPQQNNPFRNLPDRYPNTHLLDVSASYRIPPSDAHKWNASFGLSLINVFNQKNLTDKVFRGQQGFQDRYGLAFAPNLMVIVEW